MPTTLFTAGHESPRGTFYPHDAAPEVDIESVDAARLLRALRIIDRHLLSNPGHALVRPIHFAEWLTSAVPPIFRADADALLPLCDFAEEHDLLVAWGY